MPHTLTLEQQAVADERRAAREAKRAAQAAGLDQPDEVESGAKVLKRSWIKAREAGTKGKEDEELDSKLGLKVISWNILAQTLIRRDLFPGSDSLRWGDRKAMLEAELGHYGKIADVLCLQECDRLPDLIQCMPYDACVQAKGRGKQHGLVVLYRSERFGFKGSRIVHLDEEELSPGVEKAQEPDGRDGAEWQRWADEQRRRRGGTRQTKNVGLIVGLQDKKRTGQSGEAEGVIVITAHLFWHPKYQYERVRQFIVLLRALRAFQKEHNIESWPAVMAGDFNASPCEAPYQLLVNPSAPFPQAIRQRIEESRRVHNSVDKVAHAATLPVAKPVVWSDDPLPDGTTPPEYTPPSTSASTNGTGSNTPIAPPPASTDAPAPAQPVPTAKSPPEKDDEGEGEAAPESEEVMPKTVAPGSCDQILTVDELQSVMRNLVGEEGLKSAYDVAAWKGKGDDTFSSRNGWPQDVKAQKGGNEPGYTCFTALFQLTLDYLFIIPPTSSPPKIQVRQVLQPAKKEELGKGLPMKGIGASDHLAVGCDIAW